MANKKKILLELNENQGETVKNIADKNNKMYQVDVIRKLIDLVAGLKGDIKVFACDGDNLKFLDNFKNIQDMSKEKTIVGVNMKLDYNKDTGVKYELDLVQNISFGGQ